MKEAEEKTISLTNGSAQTITSVCPEDAKLLSNIASTGLDRDEDVEVIVYNSL